MYGYHWEAFKKKLLGLKKDLVNNIAFILLDTHLIINNEGKLVA